jgi:hypothetical protein
MDNHNDEARPTRNGRRQFSDDMAAAGIKLSQVTFRGKELRGVVCHTTEDLKKVAQATRLELDWEKVGDAWVLFSF